MTGQLIAFFIFAFMAITGGVLVLNLTKVIHMVLAMGLTFLGVAGLFVLLNAEFLAFVQVLIYAGAITIMMALGVMMTNQHQEQQIRRRGHTIFALLGAIIIGGFLFYGIYNTSWTNEIAPFDDNNIMTIGLKLFTDYVIPFEAASILLLVALIGAVVIAKKESDE